MDDKKRKSPYTPFRPTHPTLRSNDIALLESDPAPSTAIVETVWQGYLTLPPETRGDALLLADRPVSAKSPFDRSQDDVARTTPVTNDMIAEGETLLDILAEASGEVQPEEEGTRKCDALPFPALIAL